MNECCDNPRITVEESFAYKVILNDGVLQIDTNDYASDGLMNMACDNCNKEYNVQALLESGDVEVL